MTPLAIDIVNLFDVEFLVSIGVVAGIYAIVALGLQLNVGFTGIVNFGQAAFMAIGAYTMAILVLSAGFVLACPAVLDAGDDGVRRDHVAAPCCAGGLLAIATLALAEVVRLFAQNAQLCREGTGACSARRTMPPTATPTLGTTSRTRSTSGSRTWADPPRCCRCSWSLGDRSCFRPSSSTGSPTRRGWSCGRSARTRTPPAPSARTRSSTSCSRSRSLRCSARWPGSCSR